MKKKKGFQYRILSPDGFTIEREVDTYGTREESLVAFYNWIKRYESQGYYSSVQHGRIPLEELINYCKFILLD
jgi:hypothetical protein